MESIVKKAIFLLFLAAFLSASAHAAAWQTEALFGNPPAGFSVN
jgi:hypothetical protein